jgi:hypothetical protein
MNFKRVGLPRVVMLWICLAVAACGGREREVVRVTDTSAPPPNAKVTVTPVVEPPTAEVTVTPMTEPPTVVPALQATATPSEGSATVLPETIPTDTPMPTPTLTPEPPSGGGVLDDLDKELFVSLGGGDGAFCLGAPTGPLPLAEGEVFEYHFGHLCLWGFPAGRAATVELYDPSGQLAASREVTIDDERDGVGVVQLLLWFAGQPTGEWTVVANSAGMRVQVPTASASPIFRSSALYRRVQVYLMAIGGCTGGC